MVTLEGDAPGLALLCIRESSLCLPERKGVREGVERAGVDRVRGIATVSDR